MYTFRDIPVEILKHEILKYFGKPYTVTYQDPRSKFRSITVEFSKSIVFRLSQWPGITNTNISVADLSIRIDRKLLSCSVYADNTVHIMFKDRKYPGLKHLVAYFLRRNKTAFNVDELAPIYKYIMRIDTIYNRFDNDRKI